MLRTRNVGLRVNNALDLYKKERIEKVGQINTAAVALRNSTDKFSKEYDHVNTKFENRDFQGLLKSEVVLAQGWMVGEEHISVKSEREDIAKQLVSLKHFILKTDEGLDNIDYKEFGNIHRVGLLTFESTDKNSIAYLDTLYPEVKGSVADLAARIVNKGSQPITDKNIDYLGKIEQLGQILNKINHLELFVKNYLMIQERGKAKEREELYVVASESSARINEIDTYLVAAFTMINDYKGSFADFNDDYLLLEEKEKIVASLNKSFADVEYENGKIQVSAANFEDLEQSKTNYSRYTEAYQTQAIEVLNEKLSFLRIGFGNLEEEKKALKLVLPEMGQEALEEKVGGGGGVNEDVDQGNDSSVELLKVEYNVICKKEELLRNINSIIEYIGPDKDE
jgi:hypothetical protein